MAKFERSDLAFAAALVALKLVAMVIANRFGFSHVSDDDYSRTVIAQTFAHAPKLDPTGTSWLPAPFWITGGLMMLVGRSLAAANAIAWTFGALAPLAIYFSLLHLKLTARVAWIASLVPSLAPWSVWLASATVPEGWTHPILASALFLLVSPQSRASVTSAFLLLVCSLSRYEAWPACAFAACLFAMRVTKSPNQRAAYAGAAFVSCLGPLLWMAWNLHAHHDAFHFFSRVSAFRQFSAPRSLPSRLLEYPAALLTQFPEAIVGCALLFFIADKRRRLPFRIAILAAFAIVIFLVLGDLKDGAPTHHPERAVGAVAILFTAAGIAALVRWSTALGSKTRLLIIAPAAAVWICHVASGYAAPPGTSVMEDRTTQIARGLSLMNSAGPFVVTPCEYEHFALIAASGAPERFSIEPLTHSPQANECPRLQP